MNRYKTEIKLNNIDLEVGTSKQNTICPFCGGGRSKDKSFSVSRIATGLLYNCFRVSCKAKGFIPDLPGNIIERNKQPKHNTYNYDLVFLSSEQYTFFEEKYEIYAEEIEVQGIRYNPKLNTFAFPIYNSNYYQIGWLDRDYTGNRKPKSITYLEKADYPLVHYPIQELNTKYYIVVEDMLSAIKVSRHASCVALLGSNFDNNGTQIHEILKRTKDIVLALDPDAFKSAIGFKRRYEALFNSFTCIYLYSDPKDQSETELRKWVIR